LRQAIWAKTDPAWQVCGIPEILYSDHGPDFTSRHLEQVCADLHIQLVHSTPGMPRGRGKIERFFGSVNELFLPGLPGHLVRGVPASPPTKASPLVGHDGHLHRHRQRLYVQYRLTGFAASARLLPPLVTRRSRR
jgi:transposase InsO family protein